MDRRGFLKISSMTALMAAGEWRDCQKFLLAHLRRILFHQFVNLPVIWSIETWAS